MSPKTGTQKSAKSASVTGRAVKGFTDEERAARIGALVKKVVS